MMQMLNNKVLTKAEDVNAQVVAQTLRKLGGEQGILEYKVAAYRLF